MDSLFRMNASGIEDHARARGRKADKVSLGERVGNDPDARRWAADFPANRLRHGPRDRLERRPPGIISALSVRYPRDMHINEAPAAPPFQKWKPEGVRDEDVGLGDDVSGAPGIEQVQKLELQQRRGCVVAAHA